MLLAVDHDHRLALHHDEDLLLVALRLVVLGDRVALLDLDDVEAEGRDLEPAANERPAAVRLEVVQVPDREAVGRHRSLSIQGRDRHRSACPCVAAQASPFAFRNALATAAGVFLSTSTALFIAIIARFVSLALTALTVVTNF